jgi:hypothetical protein
MVLMVVVVVAMPVMAPPMFVAEAVLVSQEVLFCQLMAEWRMVVVVALVVLMQVTGGGTQALLMADRMVMVVVVQVMVVQVTGPSQTLLPRSNRGTAATPSNSTSCCHTSTAPACALSCNGGCGTAAAESADPC